MNILNTDIQNLIDKIKIAEEIYEKASSKIHNKPMSEEMLVMAKTKNKVFQHITDHLSLNMDEYSVKWAERVKVELEKAGMEIDHILLKINEGAVMSFCIKREEDLVKAYEEIINKENFDEYDQSMRNLIQNQLSESLRLIDVLKEKKEPYDFIKN